MYSLTPSGNLKLLSYEIVIFNLRVEWKTDWPNVIREFSDSFIQSKQSNVIGIISPAILIMNSYFDNFQVNRWRCTFRWIF